MDDDHACVKIVADLKFAHTEDIARVVENVAALVFASTVEYALIASHVAVLNGVHINEIAQIVESAEVNAFASTAGYVIAVKIAVDHKFAFTNESVHNAEIVVQKIFAFITEDVTGANYVKTWKLAVKKTSVKYRRKNKPLVSMGKDVQGANLVVVLEFATMDDVSMYAKSARAQAFVNMIRDEKFVKNATEKVFVFTKNFVKRVLYALAVSMVKYDITVKFVMDVIFASLNGVKQKATASIKVIASVVSCSNFQIKRFPQITDQKRCSFVKILKQPFHKLIGFATKLFQAVLLVIDRTC